MAFSLKNLTFLAFCVPIFLLGMGFANLVFAQDTNTNVNDGGDTNTNVNDGGDTNTRPVTKVKLENPLNNIDSIEDLIVAILNIFITLMIPVIVFFIILAGFKYVTAQGNPGKIEEATQTFMYVVIGGVLILAAVAIAEIIKNTVQAF